VKLAALTAIGAVLCGTGVAAAGMLRGSEAAFACPDPSRAPLGKVVSANRATVWCNDGASATAVVNSKSLNFTGGVCYRESGAFYVEIGTVPSVRRSASPPGFEILDHKPGAFAKDSVHLGKDAVIWDGAVTIKFAADKKSGKWAGSGYRRVGSKLESATASGKFNCKRILVVPG
jgi:hypothetical protein